MSTHLPMDDPFSPPKRHALKDFLLLPVTCLTTFSPLVLLGSLLAVLLVFVFVYFNYNVDLFGIGAPDFKELSIDSRFERVQSKDRTWVIQYETGRTNIFSGKVRHISPIREFGIPLLTHDILVTSGDFADPNRVDTSVWNHHFRWEPVNSVQQPEGTINLLHTVPWNENIYTQLMQVRSGQQVSITGYEIYKIEVFDRDNHLLGNWQDTGCNSLLVTEVIQNNP